MEFKGTRGKWEINPKASRNVRCENISVANCSAGQNGDLEQEECANALLISKAPEMLEMLNKVLNLNDMAKEHINPIFFEKIGKLIKEATELN